MYTSPLISNDTAIKVAHWLSSDPAPEDIYAVYDYVVIGVNLIAAIVGYILVVKVVKKCASNGAPHDDFIIL
ncbi:hypothetical protein ABC733_22520 [Mangrovibacter sp. SLW1]